MIGSWSIMKWITANVSILVASHRTLRLLFCIVLPLFVGIPRASADPVFGEVLPLTQPDGTAIQVRVWGDEFYRVVESLDGYTLTRDPWTKAACYARLSADGKELVSTGVWVEATLPDRVIVEPRIRINPASAKTKIAEARSRSAKRAEATRAALAPGTQPSPPITGAVECVVILVDFDDDVATIPASEVDNYCNQVGYSGYGNNGSARDYFYDVSDGLLTYTNYVPTAYYRAVELKAWYDDPDYDRSDVLLLEALNYIDTLVDFSQYDSNGDGLVDGVNLFYAGFRGGIWAAGLWPHSGSYFFSADGVSTYRYQMTDLRDQLRLGTFCHENGHMLGAWPDLYDYGYESSGVGYFCLMASGGSAISTDPAEPSAYMKYIAGWSDTTVLTAPLSGLAAPSGVNTLFKFEHPTKANEYYLIENRAQLARDAWIPDSGLAIWHIDTQGSNDYEDMTPDLHYLVTLVQADGNWDLENGFNSGDSTDLWGAPGDPECTPDTYPNTHWWDGSRSGLYVKNISAPAAKNISAPAAEMTFDISTDCNGNSIPDDLDIIAGSPDCNGNGLPDDCDLDCQPNGVPDDCDVDDGDPDGDGLVSIDCTGNGIPDECEVAPGGVLLSEELEGGLPVGWNVTGNMQITDQCPATTHCDGFWWAHAGDTATCTYGDAQTGELLPPPVTLAYGAAQLSFCSRVYTEAGWDFAMVQVNGAVVWSDSGDSGGWVDEVVDLSAYAGQTIQLNFRFESDGFVTEGHGWQVDNIYLYSESLDCNGNGIPNDCDSNMSPIAEPGGPYVSSIGGDIYLDGSGSWDPDQGCGDSIVQYEWDLNNDGVFGEEIGDVVYLSWADILALGFDTGGAPNTIVLQVTDTGGLMDMADTTLSFTDSADACPAADAGMLSSAGGTITGDTSGMADDYGHDGVTDGTDVCFSWGSSDGADTIHTFTVDVSGLWDFTTCPPSASPFDTNLMILEDLGSGCPGDAIVGCNGDDYPPEGDGCDGAPDFYYQSTFQAYLCAGKIYYLLVDSWTPGEEGPYEVTYSRVADVECVDNSGCDDLQWCNGAETCVDSCYCVPGVPACEEPTPTCDEETDTCSGCTDHSDCVDPDFCNGTETCDFATGACLPGESPCEAYQTCDEDTDLCVDPDPCVSWLAAGRSGYFMPTGSIGCADMWVFDEIELKADAGRELISYEFGIFARDTYGEGLGTWYSMETALWSVTPGGECSPSEIIPGTSCVIPNAGQIEVGGTPVDQIVCAPSGGAPTGVVLPDGDPTDHCDVDFFIGYRTATLGAGFSIAAEEQFVGGPGLDDDWGLSVFYYELCDPDTGLPSGVFEFTGFGDTVADFAFAEVCTDPLGVCCHSGGCQTPINERDCDTLLGTFTAETISIPVDCTDSDGDGVADLCDNCPYLHNSTQRDCDTDGEGDACEADPRDRDCDLDNVCNATVLDNCSDPVADPSCDDCNHNSVPDGCDIDDETSADDVGPGGVGGADGIPDECQLDFDNDGHNDADDNCPEDYNPGQEDQDFDNVGDLCDNCPVHNNPGQENCDEDDVGDACAIADGPSLDCNTNGIPDECEPDCDGNGVQDDCDISSGRHPDCNGNGIPDLCDVPAPGGICTVDCSEDCTGDGVPDECEEDCNGNEVADSCDIANCTPTPEDPDGVLCDDCDSDDVPDGCQIGACCLDGDGDGTYEGCTEDSAFMCEAGGGIFRGPCQDCPSLNAAIIPEPGGDVFVHVIGAPIDCLAETGGALLRKCPAEDLKIDPWKSDADAQMCHNFGVPASPMIPADFFCPDSDPQCGSDEWTGSICLEGVSLGDPQFPNADTLILRTGDPFDRCAIVPLPSVAAPVEIEIIALSLKSIDPITVDFDGVPNPEEWDVTVDLSTFATDPPLPKGTLTATKTHCNGGTYTSVLNVQPRFTFTKVGSNPPEVRILDTGEAGIPYVTLDQQDPVPWVAIIDPDSGVTGDPCSDFHPGLEDTAPVTDCDCNGNTTHDTCDIETDSPDCNENGIPDECDPDADGDGVPDSCDVCSGFDDLADSDGDGVPDSCDICAGGDDNVDTDGDGVPDGCDNCPDDNPDDSDGDGICTSDDNCVLYNPQQLDCQPNGVGDACDFGRGTSTDANGNGIPDECDANSLLPAPAPYNFRKNRYIAFNPNNTDPIVIQVQVAELMCTVSGVPCSYDEDCPDFAAGEECNTLAGLDPVSPQSDPEWETIGWLGESCTITPGTQVPADTWHSMVVSDMPALPGFEYTGGPLSTVFVADCEIMPRFSYGLRVSVDGNIFTERLVIGTIREPVNNAKKWADVVGQRDADTGDYTEPNQRINVDDVSVMIVFLNSKPYRPHLTVVDLSHEVPGFKINADDLQMVIRAFSITEDYPPLKFQVEASGAVHPRDCPLDAATAVHANCE